MNQGKRLVQGQGRGRIHEVFYSPLTDRKKVIGKTARRTNGKRGKNGLRESLVLLELAGN